MKKRVIPTPKGIPAPAKGPVGSMVPFGKPKGRGSSLLALKRGPGGVSPRPSGGRGSANTTPHNAPGDKARALARNILVDRPVGPGHDTRPNDVIAVKAALVRGRRYGVDPSIGLHGHPDQAMVDGIRSVQAEFGIPATGIVRPGDKTEAALVSDAKFPGAERRTAQFGNADRWDLEQFGEQLGTALGIEENQPEADHDAVPESNLQPVDPELRAEWNRALREWLDNIANTATRVGAMQRHLDSRIRGNGFDIDYAASAEASIPPQGIGATSIANEIQWNILHGEFDRAAELILPFESTNGLFGSRKPEPVGRRLVGR